MAIEIDLHTRRRQGVQALVGAVAESRARLVRDFRVRAGVDDELPRPGHRWSSRPSAGDRSSSDGFAGRSCDRRRLYRVLCGDWLADRALRRCRRAAHDRGCRCCGLEHCHRILRARRKFLAIVRGAHGCRRGRGLQWAPRVLDDLGPVSARKASARHRRAQFRVHLRQWLRIYSRWRRYPGADRRRVSRFRSLVRCTVGNSYSSPSGCRG